MSGGGRPGWLDERQLEERRAWGRAWEEQGAGAGGAELLALPAPSCGPRPPVASRPGAPLPTHQFLHCCCRQVRDSRHHAARRGAQRDGAAGGGGAAQTRAGAGCWLGSIGQAARACACSPPGAPSPHATPPLLCHSPLVPTRRAQPTSLACIPFAPPTCCRAAPAHPIRSWSRRASVSLRSTWPRQPRARWVQALGAGGRRLRLARLVPRLLGACRATALSRVHARP